MYRHRGGKAGSVAVAAIAAMLAVQMIAAAALAQTRIVWLADASGGPERLRVYENVVDAFNSSQSEVFVELEPVSNWSEYYQKAWVMIAADTAPDLVFNNSPTNVHQGMFLDLTPFIEKDPEFDLADYEPTSLGFGYAVNRPGLYTLPNHLATQGLFYNPNLFNNAGVPTPHELAQQGAWSWDDFIETGKKIVRFADDGSFLTGFAGGLMFEAFLSTFGTRIVDVVDGREVNLAGSPEVIAAMTLWQELWNDHRVLGGGGRSELFSGRLAMATGWNDVWQVYADADFDVEAVRYPWSETRSVLVAGGSWGIPFNSKNPEAAWKFLKFVVGDYGQAAFGRTAGAIPAKMDVAVEVWSDPTWGPIHKEHAFLHPILEHGMLSERMFAPSWSQVERVLSPVVGQLQRGEISPVAAAENLSRAIDGALISLED